MALLKHARTIILSSRFVRNCSSSFQRKFIPESDPIDDKQINLIQEYIAGHAQLFVLTGAGLSTESGIPDYRSKDVGLYARSNHKPIQHQEFVKSEKSRQRYWARNYVGWPQFSNFLPNECHHLLADWEKSGLVSWLVTQNVDALHAKAGSKRLTELHGCTHRVLCLNCDMTMSRHDLQDIFKKHNPDWCVSSDAVAPDGDVMLSSEQVQDFNVPDCPKCGGVMKPEVTFFGDNVKKTVVKQVYDELAQCDAVLVLGSSLCVYSGYRFMLRASELNIPIAIVNIGETRADHLAQLKISARCGHILPELNVS